MPRFARKDLRSELVIFAKAKHNPQSSSRAMRLISGLKKTSQVIEIAALRSQGLRSKVLGYPPDRYGKSLPPIPPEVHLVPFHSYPISPYTYSFEQKTEL